MQSLRPSAVAVSWDDDAQPGPGVKEHPFPQQRSLAPWGAGELRSYRGNVKTVWLGVDHPSTDHWPGGLAVSFSGGESDDSCQTIDSANDGNTAPTGKVQLIFSKQLGRSSTHPNRPVTYSLVSLDLGLLKISLVSLYSAK